MATIQSVRTSRGTITEWVVCPAQATPCPHCDAYARLPKWRWFQAFLTFVMGVPHVGQRPIVVHTPLSRFLLTYLGLWVSSASTAWLVIMLVRGSERTLLLLFLPTMVLILVTTGMFRAMHTYLLHHASHNDFGQWSRLIGELAGATAATHSFDRYRRDHNRHHAGLTDDDDPDPQSIVDLGFVPSLTLSQYRRLLIRVLATPNACCRHTLTRLRSNVDGELSNRRRAAFITIHGGLVMAAALSALAWRSPAPIVAWAVAWLLPLTYGYLVSMVIYSLGLHRWHFNPARPTRADYFAKTGARFFGDPCPTPAANPFVRLFGWCRWWLRLLAMHLLMSRVAVLGFSDNGCHDVHHAYPRGRRFDWCNSTYARSVVLLGLSVEDRSLFWHTWGLYRAVISNFVELASAADQQLVRRPA